MFQSVKIQNSIRFYNYYNIHVFYRQTNIDIHSNFRIYFAVCNAMQWQKLIYQNYLRPFFGLIHFKSMECGRRDQSVSKLINCVTYIVSYFFTIFRLSSSFALSKLAKKNLYVFWMSLSQENEKCDARFSDAFLSFYNGNLNHEPVVWYSVWLNGNECCTWLCGAIKNQKTMGNIHK